MLLIPEGEGSLNVFGVFYTEGALNSEMIQ